MRGTRSERSHGQATPPLRVEEGWVPAAQGIIPASIKMIEWLGCFYCFALQRKKATVIIGVRAVYGGIFSLLTQDCGQYGGGGYQLLYRNPLPVVHSCLFRFSGSCLFLAVPAGNR
jgi:hypothetical protein